MDSFKIVMFAMLVDMIFAFTMAVGIGTDEQIKTTLNNTLESFALGGTAMINNTQYIKSNYANENTQSIGIIEGLINLSGLVTAIAGVILNAFLPWNIITQEPTNAGLGIATITRGIMGMILIFVNAMLAKELWLMIVARKTG